MGIPRAAERDAILLEHGREYLQSGSHGQFQLAKTPIGLANWEFVIVDDGKEVLQIVTTPPRGVVTWVLRSSSRDDERGWGLWA